MVGSTTLTGLKSDTSTLSYTPEQWIGDTGSIAILHLAQVEFLPH